MENTPGQITHYNCKRKLRIDPCENGCLYNLYSALLSFHIKIKMSPYNCIDHNIAPHQSFQAPKFFNNLALLGTLPLLLLSAIKETKVSPKKTVIVEDLSLKVRRQREREVKSRGYKLFCVVN